jgi:single-strand DNA-binding protein
MNLNKVELIGNLTRDVESRTVGSNNTTLAKFGLAVNEKFTSQGEKKERTTFIDCIAWGKTGEIIAKYLKKGSPIFIEHGRLEFSSWDDKNGGGKRSKLEVVVERFQFVPTGQRDENAPARSSKGSDVDYGDIPF